MSNNPKPNTIELLSRDSFLQSVKKQILNHELVCDSSDPYNDFKVKMGHWLKNHEHFRLENIDLFPHADIIVGCHHYLDGLLIKYGIDRIQILEHDYKYYQRLRPTKQWAVPGNLDPNVPLIIATPFPGYLGLHPEFNTILDEADEKNIDIHLDMAWLSASKGITIDVNRKCIKSIGISLTKGYGAEWNRIGIRYTKEIDETDPITIYNNANMCPVSVVKNGILLLDNIPSGYLWNRYENQYHYLLKEHNLDQGNIIFAAYGKDRIIYSLSHIYLAS